MHDLPSTLLLQQSNASPKSGGDLEVLGKCAAMKYTDGVCKTLNEAVVETVKTAGLSPEQVRRVVEFANTDAFLQEHKKESAAAKYVDFHGGPADPGEVLRDLNDGGGGTVFDRGISDYSHPPEPQKKAASVDRNIEVLSKVAAAAGLGPSLGDIARDMAASSDYRGSLSGHHGHDPFGEQSKRRQVSMLRAMGHKPVVAKHAEAIPFIDDDPAETALKEAFDVTDVPLEYADPLSDSIQLRDKIAGHVDHLTSEITMYEGALQDAADDVYEHAKQAALSGVPLGQVIAAWSDVVQDPAYVKTAFRHITPRLLHDGVFEGRDDVGASLEKVAHVGTVNPEHPLMGSMSVYCLALDKLAEAWAVREELIEGRKTLNAFLEKAAGVAQLVRGATREIADSGGLVPKVLGAARKGGQAAGGAVKDVGEFLGGTGSRGAQIAGNVTEGAIAHAPTAAAGVGGALGAQELYDRAKYNPTVQGTKNFVMSRIPYTYQGKVRQYRLATQGR